MKIVEVEAVEMAGTAQFLLRCCALVHVTLIAGLMKLGD
jgi:hypothetical protein